MHETGLDHVSRTTEKSSPGLEAAANCTQEATLAGYNLAPTVSTQTTSLDFQNTELRLQVTRICHTDLDYRKSYCASFMRSPHSRFLALCEGSTNAELSEMIFPAEI